MGKGVVTLHTYEATWVKDKLVKQVEVFPCRCGQTHRGEYAAEDFAHHNCFHGVLVVTHPDQAVCRDCGASFQLVYPEGE